MADIFISYSRTDRGRIEKLASALEGEGYSVWWDHLIEGGVRFAAKIEREIAESKAVIVAWSARSIGSEWVLDEASAAKSAGKLIPISLEQVSPPMGFRQFQVIKFSNWQGEENSAAFTELCRSIYPHLHGVGNAQEGIGGAVASSLAEENTIAVLPLENLTGDASQQYFADGMHDALITDLSKISALNVISRTSTRVYGQSDKSAREIGAELGASKLIEGAVMRAGDQVRINLQLISAATDTHDWAESYEGNLGDVLKLQSDAVRDIAREISIGVTPAEESRLKEAPSVNPAAYDAYLKGMHEWYKLTPESLNAALDRFEQSLTADKDYAPAYAGIGAIWAGLPTLGVTSGIEAASKIKTAIENALARDENLAQAHFVNGLYNTWLAWDWAAGESAFLRAIELDGSFPDTHAYYAHFLCITGRSAEAAAHMERALDLDPFNPLIRSLYSVVLIFWRRLDDAVAELKKLAEAAPDHWLVMDALKYAYYMQGNEQQARAAAKSVFTILGKPSRCRGA